MAGLKEGVRGGTMGSPALGGEVVREAGAWRI
jgi:hypothetical protein